MDTALDRNTTIDIFISYAHIDDEPGLSPEGWVTAFHTELQKFVQQYSGLRELKIWRDVRLQINNDFSNEIINAVRSARVIIVIMSPPYTTSRWCQKEITLFSQHVQDSLVGGNLREIFKVVKYPPDPELPEELRKLTGIKFYEVDGQSETISDFQLRKFQDYVAQVAQAIGKVLQTSQCINVGRSDLPSSKSVYLAETSRDMEEQRDKVRREMELLNYRILPKAPLISTSNIREAVRSALSECDLSVHILGARYGTIPEGEEQSLVDLQQELAEQHDLATQGFARLIWAPIGLQIAEARQKKLLEQLQNAPDYLRTSLEDLKTRIHDKLVPTPAPLVVPQAKTGLANIYLIVDGNPTNMQAVKAVDDYLSDLGFTVDWPLSDPNTDPATRRLAHEQNLRDCDAVLVYYGECDEKWVRGKLMDLRKLPAYGRTRPPLLARAVLIAPPVDSTKLAYEGLDGALVLKLQSADELAIGLQPLVNKLSGIMG
jgi:TIR domain/Domain of unknown function (DUF4062)